MSLLSCQSKLRPWLHGFATWYKSDLKGQCGLFLPSPRYHSGIQPEARLVKSTEKVHSWYLLSLAGSDMLFVCVSVFHTCFETAREDNVRKEGELPYFFFVYQATPGRILSKDKTPINSQLCCGFYTWHYKLVFCFGLILFTNKFRKWNLKTKKEGDSIILASLHFMLLLLLPMERLSGCFRLFSFTECDCMSWPNFPNHWSCCKCSADLFLAYVQKVHELGGILIEDNWRVSILLFCITRCSIPYTLGEKGS